MSDKESEFCLCMNSAAGRAIDLWPSLLAHLPVALEAEGAGPVALAPL